MFVVTHLFVRVMTWRQYSKTKFSSSFRHFAIHKRTTNTVTVCLTFNCYCVKWVCWLYNGICVYVKVQTYHCLSFGMICDKRYFVNGNINAYLHHYNTFGMCCVQWFLWILHVYWNGEPKKKRINSANNIYHMKLKKSNNNQIHIFQN